MFTTFRIEPLVPPDGERTHTLVYMGGRTTIPARVAEVLLAETARSDALCIHFGPRGLPLLQWIGGQANISHATAEELVMKGAYSTFSREIDSQVG